MIVSFTAWMRGFFALNEMSAGERNGDDEVQSGCSLSSPKFFNIAAGLFRSSCCRGRLQNLRARRPRSLAPVEANGGSAAKLYEYGARNICCGMHLKIIGGKPFGLCCIRQNTRAPHTSNATSCARRRPQTGNAPRNVLTSCSVSKRRLMFFLNIFSVSKFPELSP